MQEQLAALVADTKVLPATAIEAAQTFLLDTLAIGVAGRNATFREQVAAVARTWGNGGACNVLGEGDCYPPATAAYLNALQMHGLEFDCVHEGAVAHAMTAPVAAALAECQQRQVSGTELLRALVLGVEVAAVLGLAAQAPLTFFRPATTGVFGAAATVAALRGYDADQVLVAFGHALAQAAGTMQAHEEGKPTLPLQLAAAARGGLVAADLADTGIGAPRASIDGRFGYLSMFETACDTSGLVAALGSPWRVTELSHKPYPSGRATHGGVEAVLGLRQQGVSVTNVERLVLEAPALIHQLVIRPANANMNVNYARLCFAYVGAVALLRGEVTLDDFSVTALQDPQVLALAARFDARLTDGYDPAAFTPQKLTAILTNGQSVSIDVPELLGSPRRPLDRPAQQRKVSHCLAQVYADRQRATRLIECVQSLPGAVDARVLLASIIGD